MESMELINGIMAILNTGGVIAVLVVVLVFFLRGDLLPRKVWVELTEKVTLEISMKVVSAVQGCLKEEFGKVKTDHKDLKDEVLKMQVDCKEAK